MFGQDGQYTKDGDMALPKNYREWVFLSSGIGMTYASTAGGNPNFENVFVNPGAYQAFLKTGTWPDKTVMILEIRKSDSKVSINKDGRVQTDVAAIEAHVKDSARGGWAFVGFGKSDTVKLIGANAVLITVWTFVIAERLGAVLLEITPGSLAIAAAAANARAAMEQVRLIIGELL